MSKLSTETAQWQGDGMGMRDAATNAELCRGVQALLRGCFLTQCFSGELGNMEESALDNE